MKFTIFIAFIIFNTRRQLFYCSHDMIIDKEGKRLYFGPHRITKLKPDRRLWHKNPQKILGKTIWKKLQKYKTSPFLWVFIVFSIFCFLLCCCFFGWFITFSFFPAITINFPFSNTICDPT